MTLLGFAAAVTSAFNLVCAGTITTNSMFVKDKVEAYTSTYRVDLASRKWCEGECKAIRPIHDVQPAFLVLDEPKDVDTATEHELFRSEISRETGKQTMISQSGRGDEILLMKWSGQCERAPFGGFPKLTTKF